MADIEIVVKVDKRDVDLVRKYFKPTGYSFIPLQIQTEFVSAILNGTLLEKGHGKVIDASHLLTVTDIRSDGTEFTYVPYSEIDSAPAIVEADKEIKDE